MSHEELTSDELALIREILRIHLPILEPKNKDAADRDLLALLLAGNLAMEALKDLETTPKIHEAE